MISVKYIHYQVHSLCSVMLVDPAQLHRFEKKEKVVCFLLR
jgi:hypothetical protein